MPRVWHPRLEKRETWGTPRSFFCQQNTYAPGAEGGHPAIARPKERGEWAELRFMARAAEEGFRVSKPWGDSARYDFALEAHGHFLRVQVKSSISRSGAGYACAVQPIGRSIPSRRYTGEQVDFVAAYIIPEDVWYILPAEVIERVAGQIQLSPASKKQK